MQCCCMLQHAFCCKLANLHDALQAVPRIAHETTISKLADVQLHLSSCHAAAAPEKQCKNRMRLIETGLCPQAEAVDKARGSGNDAAVSGRGALYERLLEAQGRQEQAAASAAAEEAANAAATAELRAACAEAADLKLRIM